MKRRTVLLAASGLALASAAPADAAQVGIGVLDDGLNATQPVWSATSVAILPGDTVVWNLGSRSNPPQVHNLVSVTEPGSTAWTGLDEQPPVQQANRTFTTQGRYRFVCTLHSGVESGAWSGMVGTVVVGNPPPPPPPPLSAQPFPNDAPFTQGALEVGGLDTTRPALRGVAAEHSGRRVKLSFRVSERSVVTVRLSRGSKRVRTKRAHASHRGSVMVRGLAPGRYTARITATDVAGNASRARTATFRIG